MTNQDYVREYAGGRAIVQSVTNRLRLLLQASWATFIVTISVLACSSLGLLTIGVGLDDALVNEYVLVQGGEFWRPFTSWLLHLDYQHLLYDIVYLLVVGLIFEKRHGGRSLLLVFMLATVAASWVCVAFDPHYVSERGSSTGTHALTAFFATWIVTREDEPVIIRFMWLVVLGYLVYVSVVGILTGHMGWPFEFFPNCGVDHLAAVGVAMILAVLLPSRRALRTVHVEGHSKSKDCPEKEL